MQISNALVSKYLYKRGESTIAEGTPISTGLGISLFQDAVEIMIRGIVKAKNINVSDKAPFFKLWDAVDKKLGNNSLPDKPKMRDMNDLRVRFKHFGYSPNRVVGDEFRIYTLDFLETCSKIWLDIDFNKLSMADMIENEEMKNPIKEAEKELENGEYRTAITLCKTIYKAIVDVLIATGQQSSLSMLVTEASIELEGKPKLLNLLFHLMSEVNLIRAELWSISSGIRSDKHYKFDRITPALRPDYETMHVLWPSENEPTFEDAAFCIDFVTEFVLAWQKQ